MKRAVIMAVHMHSHKLVQAIRDHKKNKKYHFLIISVHINLLVIFLSVIIYKRTKGVYYA